MHDRTVPLSRLIAKPFSFLKDRPVLLRTKRYTVVGYGLLASLNALAIASLTALYLHVHGVEMTASVALVFPILGVGIWAGSKLMHLFALGRKLFVDPVRYATETGFYVQGGIIGALVTSVIAAQVLGIDTALFWDGLGWSTMLGLFFGRLGCFNYGCCYGRPTGDQRAGVCYHNHEVKALRLHPELYGVALHPTQIYTALAHLTAFTLATVLILTVGVPQGYLAAGFFVHHGVTRLILERFRADIFFHEGRNWTTYRTAGATVLTGVAMFLSGSMVFSGFGREIAMIHPLSPSTLISMTLAEPLFPLAVGALMVIVVTGFGVHGRKLGTFPFSPENRHAAPQEGLTTVRIARTTHG